jgi:phosphoglycerol transferase
VSPRRSLVAGALLAALLTSVGVVHLTSLWDQPLHVPFQYAQTRGDDEQDATLDLMLIKNIHEQGWFGHNPRLNAPFEQQWSEWPMGGDLLAYTVKKALVETTGDVPLTFNLFWLLTFPLTALIAFPTLRALRCSWATALVGAVLFALAPYHFRNGAAHENLAFYVGIPVIVLLCVRILGPDRDLPTLSELRHRAGWWRLRWLLLGTVLVAVTGIYYLAFLLTLLVMSAVIGAIARRRPGRLALAALFAGVGLAASVLANLPTLAFRWSHAPNVLGVPDRAQGVSEHYPLRIVELLSPVTGHRLGPFASLADQLYDPGRQGFDTAMLGLAGAIGLVCALVAVLTRAVHREHPRSWSLEARLGIVMLSALLLAMEGGISRALELVGLNGVRAWTRIAVVVTFAALAVFARLLDRLRASMHRRHHPLPRAAWVGGLALVLVLGALDQASPVLMPHADAREGIWSRDERFVAALERRLPPDAMVFQLPVVDFPEHGSAHRMSAHDLIKEGYLHSRTLRWSAGGVRGRSGEWQFPAAQRSRRKLLRGITALGFRALMIDRYGYADDGEEAVAGYTALLGPPIARGGRRLVAWDLGPSAAARLADLDASGRRALRRRVLDAPRVYLDSDVDPITDRGDRLPICTEGSLVLVNPAGHAVRAELTVSLRQEESGARHATLVVRGHRSRITADEPAPVTITLPPGTTRARVEVATPGVRCQSVPLDSLPSVAARLRRG